MKTFLFGQDHLTVSKAWQLAKGELLGQLSPQVIEKVRASSESVRDIVNSGKTVYGINTGFGPLCTTLISPDQATQLQENILKSHAVGVGDFLSDELVSLMLITKIHALAKGHSGITIETLSRVIWHLEEGIFPVVPEQGSVGASGDLAPLSHLFLPLIGEGLVRVKGEVLSSSECLARYGKQPLKLSPKEGLALINGTQFMLAHAVKLLKEMHTVLEQEDLISAMMLEGCKASVAPFDAKLHAIRPYEGSQHVAQRIRTYLDQSEIVHSHADCARVQDPYSLRCIPQVHGASREAWAHLYGIVETELNSVTDNPLLFEEAESISGGNFHGQPLALPLDYVALALSELGNIADRRIYLSLTGDTPGVPKLLLEETGTNSGFMILQYTTAALASENKSLCFPSSADSIPTSLGQEDHVSMGSISGRKALRILDNIQKIQAIELMCAAQAISYHAPLESGKIISELHRYIRETIPFVTEDQVFTTMIEGALRMIREELILKKAREVSDKHNIDLETHWSKKYQL